MTAEIPVCSTDLRRGGNCSHVSSGPEEVSRPYGPALTGLKMHCSSCTAHAGGFCSLTWVDPSLQLGADGFANVRMGGKSPDRLAHRCSSWDAFHTWGFELPIYREETTAGVSCS